MKREDKKAATKAKILAAATSLYSEKGFVDVSIEEISRAAGVGKGTVFLHFGNQGTLMETVINQLIELFDQKMTEQGQELRSLEDYLLLHLTVLEAHEALYCHFITQRLYLGETMRFSYVSLQSVFSHYFEKAVKSDLELPLDFLYTSWLGMIHYYLANRDLFGGHNIIAANKEKWAANYLILFNQGGLAL